MVSQCWTARGTAGPLKCDPVRRKNVRDLTLKMRNKNEWMEKARKIGLSLFNALHDINSNTQNKYLNRFQLFLLVGIFCRSAPMSVIEHAVNQMQQFSASASCKFALWINEIDAAINSGKSPLKALLSFHYGWSTQPTEPRGIESPFKFFFVATFCSPTSFFPFSACNFHNLQCNRISQAVVGVEQY